MTQTNIKHNTKMLIQASRKGDVDQVKQLIPVSDPKTDHSAALRLAATLGYTDIVQLLIPVSNPKADNSAALFWAAAKGHTNVVEQLIPVSNPKANDSEALLWAAKNEHTQIVQLLLPVSDYWIAEQYMKQEGLDTTLLLKYINQYEAHSVKKHLTQELTSQAENKHSSVKRKM